MSGTVSKVDMSLDDIIKLNKRTKSGKSPLNRQGKGGAPRSDGSKRNQRNGGFNRVGGYQGKGNVNKNKTNNSYTKNRLQKKRQDALKKLREAKQALALIDSKKNFTNKRQGLQNQQQKRPRINRNYGSTLSLTQLSPQQNVRQGMKRNFTSSQSLNQGQQQNKRNRMKRNFTSSLPVNQRRQQNSQGNTNRPRINRNYGSNMSLTQLGNTGKKLNNRRNQWNNNRNNQSYDDSLTVSVSNTSPRKRQNRNRKQKQSFTEVSLNERFGGTRNNKKNKFTGGRQVFF
ncbi:hypothetical protein SNE40_000616 [Patella caerulea]|uniref:Uncharacterized protein n=1 Tax=Patella caerulea TaxID=87958 RepID=A0AAN8QA76_PATCE